MVWTMYNERNGPRNGSKRPPHENELPLEAFAANRNAVVREVLRAKVRHWDNIVTALEECLRQCDMLSRMCNMVRENAQQQICKAWRGAGIMLTLPWLLVAFLWRGDLLMGGSGWQTEEGGNSFMIQAFVLCCLLCLIVLGLTLEQLRQFDRIQLSRAGLETMFETVYHHIFIHTGGEDLRVRWATVRPLLEAMLKSVKNPTQLPVIEPWELTRIHDVLEQNPKTFGTCDSWPNACVPWSPRCPARIHFPRRHRRRASAVAVPSRRRRPRGKAPCTAAWRPTAAWRKLPKCSTRSRRTTRSVVRVPSW